MRDDILFYVETTLGFRVRTALGYWDFLVTEKHKVMAGRENDVIRVLHDPDEVQGNRVLIKSAMPGSVIPAKAGIHPPAGGPGTNRR